MTKSRLASAKRHHFVPRFLLKRFGRLKARDTFYVWVFPSGKQPFETNVINVALEKGFYGSSSRGIEDDLAALEDAVQDSLTLIDAGQLPSPTDPTLLHFMCTLSFRTYSVRAHYGNAITKMFDAIRAGAATDKARVYAGRHVDSLVGEHFDQTFLDALPNLPPETQRAVINALSADPQLMQRLKATVAASRHTWYPALVEGCGDFVKQFLDELNVDGFVARMTTEGHLKAMESILRNDYSPTTFRPVAWQLVVAPEGDALLGDIGAFARSSSGTIGSIFRFRSDWSEFYLPLSPRQVLVAMRSEQAPILDISAINEASARLSCRHVYGPTESAGSAVVPLLGTASPLMSSEDLREVASHVWE